MDATSPDAAFGMDARVRDAQATDASPDAATVATLIVDPPASDPQAIIDLSTDGLLDWSHWGSSATTDRKFISPHLIGTLSTNGHTLQSYGNDSRTYSWDDGTIYPTLLNVNEGVFVTGAGGSLMLDVVSTASLRTLVMYCGAFDGAGTLTVTLPGVIDPVVVNPPGGLGTWTYAITVHFSTPSPSSLALTWELTSDADAGAGVGGNVTLSAVTVKPD